MNRRHLRFLSLGLLAGLVCSGAVWAQQIAVPAPPQRAPQAQAVRPTLEDRVDRLEAALATAAAREAALEARYGQHTHSYVFTNVSFLSEPINGRRIPLAISPRTESGKTTAPLQ